MAATDPAATDPSHLPDAGPRRSGRALQLFARFLVSVAAWFLLATLMWPDQTVHRRISNSLVFAVLELIGDLFFFRPSPASRDRTAMRRYVRRGTLPNDEETRTRLLAYVVRELETGQPLWRTASVFGGLAAAVVTWGVVRGGEGQVGAGLVLAGLFLSLIPRERAALSRLQRVDRMLDPARERSVRV
jgi:hypothetical protein